jgi:hypothetical protein
MISVNDKLNYRGELEVFKIYKDGREELHYKDSNVVVSGLGYGLSLLFSGEASQEVEDYKLLYYQLGVSGSSDLQASTTYGLGSSLSLPEYTDLNIPSLAKEQNQIKNEYIFPKQAFGKVTNPIIVDSSSIRFNIIVDELLANNLKLDRKDLYLNEIGLFMANPLGDTIRTTNVQFYEGTTSKDAEHTHVYKVDEKGCGEAYLSCHPTATNVCHSHKIENWLVKKEMSEIAPMHIHHIPIIKEKIHSPVLVAYRAFSNIYKSSDFSLSFRWTIHIR